MLDRQGIVMNQKKLRRLYREEKLQVRRRGGRKRALGTRRPMLVPDRANARWSLDFVSDTLLDHFMDKDLPLSPGMPWIKKLALVGPVGVPSLSCTTRCDRIHLWTTAPRRQMQSCGRLRNPDQLRRPPQP
ncbi:MAG: hypothetical protein EOQ36_33705 [Mesorhizobium sp.]|nr:MAG: hypothetical protein EOQ36_33705 [Mesorhizobium sp.]RWP53073.1 MAG: hypothetical protein EOR07_34615 [Mesorhizobium sp.]